MNKKLFLCIVLITHIVFMLHAQNTNLPVGAILGAIDVSPLGAATYTIPIEVVPGTQGMQPNLSIQYNSFGGMGLLGMKWNLTGLSAITRCGQTPYYDNGNVTAISFNEDDKFAIDGERLLRLNRGDYGNVGGEYATEIENFTRIISYGTGNNIAHFKAYTDDGSIIEYGNSTNSQQKMENSNNILSWYINKITDANGNYMTFHYGGTGGEILIDSIKYTGNGFAPYAKVVFDYTTNTLNSNIYFIRGYGISQAQLLEAITVFYKDTIVRKYEFKYNLDDAGERTAHLTEVILYGENETERLNETAITWGVQNNEKEEKEITSFPGEGYIITGDFNGDGYTDYIAYGLGSLKRDWKFYAGSATGTFTLKDTSRVDVSLDDETKCYFYAADINGDGCDELITAERSPYEPTAYVFKIFSLQNGVTQFENLGPDSLPHIFIRNFRQVVFGDFDGDGKTDMLFVGTGEDGGWALQLFIDSEFKAEAHSLPSFNTLCRVRVGDFNGDGKTDIELNYTSNSLYVCYYNNATEAFDCNYVSYSFYGYDRYSGDFNGDGITDLLTYEYINGGLSWKLYFGKGDGTYTDSTIITNLSPRCEVLPNGQYIPQCQIIIADLDGDGKDDIIELAAPHNLRILYSKECINGQYGYTPQFKGITGGFSPSKGFNIADFNNDGILDIVTQKQPRDKPRAVYLHRNEQYEYPIKIKDGMEKTIELNYKSQYYIAQSLHYANDWINSSKKYFFSVVSSLKISNGIGNGLNTWQYRYHNPIYSSLRRTFLGFKGFTSVNNQDNRKDSCNFGITIYAIQILSPAQQISFCNNEEISKKHYYILAKDLSTDFNIRFAPYALTSEYDMLSNTYTSTNNVLNNKGRLQESKTWIYPETYSFDPIGFETKEYTYHDISLSTSNSYHKKTVPQTIITTQEYRNPDNQFVEITDTLTYGYGQQGRLAWMRKGNPHGSITTSYGNYTNTGISKEKTVSAAGCTARIEKYNFDDTERFLKQITNPLDHVTNFTYDAKTGNKLSETDPNGFTTTYSYDSFGNLTKITYPDGTHTNISIDRYTGRYIPNASYYTTTTSTGKPTLEVYYDILGREVCRMDDGVFLDTRYNAKGQVTQTSYPYSKLNEPDGSKTWSKYTYDEYGRQKTVKAPYTDLLYEYDEREVTITDNLRDVSSSKTHDALGRIVNATDHGGTITYQYEVTSDKKHQTTIKVNGTATTTILSDLWGNRLSITEPNAGEIVSTYNGFNELVEQKDARNNITYYTYDKLGRVIKKQFTGATPQTVNYYYDEANHGVGKLHKVSTGTQTQELFSYDALGRLATHTKSIDANAALCKHIYTYNANGQLHTLTYPSGFGVTYSYTETGKLNEIRRSDNNDLIYRVSSRNKYQQPNRCYFGNDMATDYTYNTHGLLTRINTGNMITIGTIDPGDTAIIGPGGTTGFSGGPIGIIGVDSAILNYRYAYDDKGLMISRSENIIDRLEKYEYDNLDRLTKITSGAMGQTGTPQTFSYHSNGNISNNSNVGYYTYMGKPHAVGRIEPVSTNVMSNNQCVVIYNSFNQPTKITEGNYGLDLSYDVCQQRQKTERYKNNSLEFKRYYIDKRYETDMTTIDRESDNERQYHYIYGDNGVVALYVVDRFHDYSSNGGVTDYTISTVADSMYYIHTDHLGSYCAITDANKGVKQRNYFDPWGNYKTIYGSANGSFYTIEGDDMGGFDDPSGTSGIGLPPGELQEAPTLNFTLADRGFTGHEHYPFFKIINMNGRLYDPVIARFFSPDKYVANSTFTQDFNTYHNLPKGEYYLYLAYSNYYVPPSSDKIDVSKIFRGYFVSNKVKLIVE